MTTLQHIHALSSDNRRTQRVGPLSLIFVAIVSVSFAQLMLLSANHDGTGGDSGKNPLSRQDMMDGQQQKQSSSDYFSKYSISSSSLEAYDPARFPVFSSSSLPSISNKVKVGIVTIDPLVGEARHFLYDGVVKSDHMDLVGVVSLYSGSNNTHPSITFKPQDADVWLVDGARVAKLKRNFTSALLNPPHKSRTQRPLKVVFVDYTDRFEFQVRHYNQLGIWDKPHVRLAVRTIIQGRNFVSPNETNPGRIATNHPTACGPMIHCPYSVRSDIVETIRSIALHDDDKKKIQSIDVLEHAIFDDNNNINRQRSMDVIHMWQISYKEGKSKLRNAVSKLVRGLNGTEMMSNEGDGKGNDSSNHPSSIILQTSIEEHGQRRKVGRNTVDSEYVAAMLKSKIVVVTQKDDWEDHYRLFEAVVSGALVIADRMLAPPKDFVDKQSIVFFDTIPHLEKLINYYLFHPQERKQIALEGWKLAMTRHRSWHRIEEVLVGRILTQVKR